MSYFVKMNFVGKKLLIFIELPSKKLCPQLYTYLKKKWCSTVV